MPDNWGVIRADGEDAAKFLQGQLTQDVLGLAPGEARLAGWCSAKGRLLASFVVWRDGPDGFLLACRADLLAPTLQRLKMFVLRARCQLIDASPQWQFAAAWGQDLAPLLAPGSGLERAGTVAPLPGARRAGTVAIRLPDTVDGPWILVASPVPAPGSPPPGADEDPWAGTLGAPLAARPPTAWELASCRAGVVWIAAATRELFVPQSINFERLGGVDFRKGCYPGQEVVARSQYRGTLKRRLQRLGLPGPAAPGQEVFHSADPGQPAGTLAAVAASLGAPGAGTERPGWEALAELKLTALEGGSLHLGSAEGPRLVLLDLPEAARAPAPGTED